jgi:hypothetical protein
MPTIPDGLPLPPAWCDPGTRIGLESITFDGQPIACFARDIGAVTIAQHHTLSDDGRWAACPPVIRVFEPNDGLDAAGARRLAAELLDAADLLDG